MSGRMAAALLCESDLIWYEHGHHSLHYLGQNDSISWSYCSQISSYKPQTSVNGVSNSLPQILEKKGNLCSVGVTSP